MPARCPRCDRSMVQITITLDGDDVTLQSCSACDHRIWERGGESVDLHGVLGELGVDLSEEPNR